MYEMMTGRPPYDGETPVSVAIQHINAVPEKPSAFNPNIPEGLEQIIMRSMSHDLADRYATATAMLYDMDELRKDPAAHFVFQRAERNTGGLSVVETARNEEDSSIAEKKVQKNGPADRNKRRNAEDAEERSRVTVIAIVACSIVALLAILVCMVLLIGNTPPSVRQVQIPGLVGRYFDDLPQYNGIVVVQQVPEYSSEYEKGKIIRQEPEGGSYHREGTVVFVVVSLGEEPPASTMVDLVGMDAAVARKYLEDLDISLYILPREEHSDTLAAGQITRTRPADGEPLQRGETVILWISLGPKVEMARMPNLLSGAGYMMDTAESILNNNKFYNLQWIPVDSTAPKGRVLSQSVTAGEEIDVNTLIVLEYSTGIAPTEPTDPSGPNLPPMVSVDYVFALPEMTEAYTLRIEHAGQQILTDTLIQPEQRELPLELTGNGTMYYTLYVNGELYETVTVNFEADE
jgi:serine/threonine-protein kinase